MKSASVSLEAAGVPSVARNGSTFSTVFDRRLLLIGLWVFAGYYVGCKIGFALTFHPHPVSVLWPPNSVLVAALLLTPPRVWWFVLLAAFPAHLAAQFQSHVPPLMILCWFISNSCEALIGAGLTRYLAGGPSGYKTFVVRRTAASITCTASYYSCVRTAMARVKRGFAMRPAFAVRAARVGRHDRLGVFVRARLHWKIR